MTASLSYIACMTLRRHGGNNRWKVDFRCGKGWKMPTTAGMGQINNREIVQLIELCSKCRKCKSLMGDADLFKLS